MAVTTIVTDKVSGGVSLGVTKSFSAQARTVISDETIADSATDAEVAFNLDVTECVAFAIISDQDITLETNDGSTPDDTLALVANKPYIWTTDKYDTFKFTTDITALFFTNSSGSAANVSIMALYDPTP